MKQLHVSFAIVASLFTIAFLFVVNWITTPEELWAIYPASLLMFWPLNSIFRFKHGYKWHSLITAILLIIVLLTNNLLQSPEYFWILYAWLPLLYWPLVTFAGRRAGEPTFAVLASIVFIVYYIGLNLLYEPRFPWFIFPAFVILWWPLSVTFARRPLLYSVLGTLLVMIFFINVNVLTSPGVIWAVYPIFAVLWWPLSVYFYVYKRTVNR